MGAIKLKHTSGNGTILNSPAANPTNDITLKLPSTTGSAGQGLQVASANHSSTNAELEFGADASGKVLQVVNTTTNGAASVALTNAYGNNNSNIYYLTSLNTSLTTTATNSKILISGNIFGETSTYDHVISFVLSSSINSGTTTPIDTLRGQTYGDRPRVTSVMSLGYYDDDQTSTPSVTSFSNYMYEPAQASGTSITISIGIAVTDGFTGNTFYLNRTVSDNNTSAYEKGASSVTLMEVSA